MSTMISEVYDALRAAGAPEDQARKAAEAVATYDHRLGSFEGQLIAIRGDLALLKWMIGFCLALMVAVLWRVFT